MACAAAQALALGLFASSAEAQSASNSFDIPAEPLPQAVLQFSQQANIDVVAPAELTRGKTAHAVHGVMSSQAAFRQLLEGTGLSVASGANGGLVLVQGDVRPLAQSAGPAPEQEAIIVTAQKRSEAAQNVPMGLTVLSGENLTKRQSFRLQDFAGNLPGISIVSNVGGGFDIVSRGLTVGSDLGSMTAIYLDETPIQTPGYATDFSNFDTYDITRVEFLKGPQGTLYGANAAGGLLKYVTNAPDPLGFHASFQGGLSAVYRGSQVGSDLHGMINVPLSDTAAVRLVGYNVYYPGFTDDLSLGAKDINQVRSTGGRGSFLWWPSNKLSIRLSALYHREKDGDFGNGTEDVYAGTLTPVYGPLIQNFLEARQPTTASTSIESLTANWDLGFANLVSESSVYQIDRRSDQDVSAYAFGQFLSTLFFSQVHGMLGRSQLKTSAIVQEIRLSSKNSSRMQWLIGGYFADQNFRRNFVFCPVDLVTHQVNCALPTDPSAPFGTGSPVGGDGSKVKYREYAVFGNADYHFTSNFDVAFGGRYSSNIRENSPTILIGPFGALEGGFGRSTVHEKIFQYSIDARWHPNGKTMVYARVATGYQPGGANNPFPGVPPSYKYSTTINYEVGAKASVPALNLTAELALYHITWRDIGVFVGSTTSFLSFIANAAGAHSDGAELQLNFTPLRGLAIVASGSYDHAYLSSIGSNALLGAQVGDRLPHVPLWQGAVDASYEKRAFGRFSGFFGANLSYNSNRLEYFPDPRPFLPAFAKIDFRAGFESDKYSFTAYVKNVTNNLAPNSLRKDVNAGWAGPLGAQGLLPRTFGATFGAKF